MADDAAAPAAPDGHWQDVHPPLTVKVFQWNVLADCCANNTAGGFPFVPPEALDLKLRRPLQLEEILDADADVVALEEVDAPHDFEEALKEHEYEVLYNKREDSPLGVLVAYKKKYKFLTKNLISFSRSGQVAIIVRLQDTSCNRTFVFAATHLKAKTDATSAHHRRLQSEELLFYVMHISDDWHDRRNGMRGTHEATTMGNIIVAGGFNDDPHSVTCKTWTSAECFESAYPDREKTTFRCRRMDGTTLLDPHVCAEDYILHTGTVARICELVQDIPSPYLPSITFPSDHLSLCAELVFVNPE